MEHRDNSFVYNILEKSFVETYKNKQLVLRT